MFKVIVTGANSAPFGMSEKFPDESYPSLAEASDVGKKWESKFVSEGFHRTKAGIYIRGTEWRSVMITSRELNRPIRPDGTVI